jgi:hypothetical protein
MHTIKEEEVDLSDYANYADAVKQVGRFFDEVYMHKRIHSSLGYLTPAEFESQWKEQQVQQTTIPGFQPKGEEGACRMSSLPSGSRGWISLTR